MDESRHGAALGLAYLFGTGGALVLISLALPHTPNAAVAGVAGVAVAALVVSGVFAVRGDRMPVLAFTLMPGLGSVFVSLGVWWGGDMARAYALFYVWVSLYAFYFLPRSRAIGLTLWSAATYGCVLLARDVTPVPWVDLMLVLGTTWVAGTLIGGLALQLRRRAADLDAAAGLANAMSAGADVSWAREAICRAALEACGADAAVLLEPDGPTAHAGDRELGRRTAARPEVLVAHRDGERHTLDRNAALAQPVLRDGRPAAVLVIAWSTPPRILPERAATAAELFAAEAAVVLEREERLSGENERRALEINDSIVQGLVVAKYALDAGQVEQGAAAIEGTLRRARELMDRQLGNGDAPPIRPGDLRRGTPSLVGR
jgi:hypothetical protein